jgi:hypothetical protein
MGLDKRPPLLKLGGEEAFGDYQRQFDRLYRRKTLQDVLGRTVLLRRKLDDCEHLCYVEHRDDVYKQGRRHVWSQTRAERIGWLELALMHPDEVRPDPDPNCQIYLLTIPADPSTGAAQERYGAVVEVETKTCVRLCSAYPMDESKWNKVRRSGVAVYPPRVKVPGTQPAKKKKRR